jgi:autotransporter strand-loop-strand O-heptosyltransferase
MFDLKIRAVTSLIGTTGYNNHAQSFFRALSKYTPVEVRNFTIGKSWNGYSDEPHDGESYMDAELKCLLTEQSLWNDQQELLNYPIYQNWPNPGTSSVNLVLAETDHHYFYQKYTGYKIAFNVWESTLQPENFFNQLLKFDELWVPSKWQKQCTVDQGYPEDKVFVIPEGVDVETFYPEKAYHVLTGNPKRFTFALFGRWDYRKSTKEIIETFLKTFSHNEPVDLIISIDNPYSGDNLKTTEARLEHYQLLDSRIKILHLPPRDEYVKLMKSSNVFLSCSRAEGWNLPLIEAMACGTPSIYSACSAQMEFAEGRGLPVKIVGERPASESSYNHFNMAPGNYYEPDFEDLSRVMRDAYVNYAEHKKQALIEAKEIHDLFNWDRIAILASEHLEKSKDHITDVIRADPNHLKLTYHFINGPHVEITDGDPSEFRVDFINNKTRKVEHTEVVKNNMWVSATKQYFVDWRIVVTEMRSGTILLDKSIDLKGKKVYIPLESKAIGDTLAWFPAIEEFRKKHGCEMVCSTFHNEWFIKNYPDIKFIIPGTSVDSLVAMYNIGWYHTDAGEIDMARHPMPMRDQPMQKSAFDILGLEYVETLPIIDKPVVKKKKQIAIAIHGTAQPKYWNKADGWQDVVNWCKSKGFSVLLLSKEEAGYMGNPHPTGIKQLQVGPLTDVMKAMLESVAFIGIGSGLSWVSWALKVPTVLISGFSYPYTETSKNTYRVSTPDGKCTGCFNRVRLDAGDWDWCPDHKNTQRMFECTRSITSAMVIEQLEELLKDSYR